MYIVSFSIGETCEINNSQQFDLLTCPQGLCEPPSQCEPNKNAGGFHCKGCPAEPHYNKYCQLTSRKFSIGSYLTFPAFKRRFRFNIQLKWVFFASWNKIWSCIFFKNMQTIVTLLRGYGQIIRGYSKEIIKGEKS